MRGGNMPKKHKKYTFDVTLFEGLLTDTRLNITCDELKLQTELVFESEDEWSSMFALRGKVFDVHLLKEEEEWEVSIYSCFPEDPKSNNGILMGDYSEEGQHTVNLVIHKTSIDEGEDEEEELADCIVREYEWTCVHCQDINLIYEWTEDVYCGNCGKKNKLSLPEHAYP
jgi:hypothetical protein